MNRRVAVTMAKWMLACLILGLVKLTKETAGECYSCVSNADWSYYMERIPSLRQINLSVPLPVAPMACAFDPIRIYGDHTSVKCEKYCAKWSSVTILDDGSLKVNVLRSCADSLLNFSTTYPEQDRCYQKPHDFTHKKNIEYQSVCYCKSFMCNLAPLTFKFPICVIVICIFSSEYISNMCLFM